MLLLALGALAADVAIGAALMTALGFGRAQASQNGLHLILAVKVY